MTVKLTHDHSKVKMTVKLTHDHSKVNIFIANGFALIYKGYYSTWFGLVMENPFLFGFSYKISD